MITKLWKEDKTILEHFEISVVEDKIKQIKHDIHEALEVKDVEKAKYLLEFEIYLTNLIKTKAELKIEKAQLLANILNDSTNNDGAYRDAALFVRDNALKTHVCESKKQYRKEADEKWSKDVQTKVKEEPGILSGSGSEIAKKALSQHGDDAGKAIHGLTFRKNEAGSNMSATMKDNIDAAINILHDKLEKEKK
jgi:hypothetical protein